MVEAKAHGIIMVLGMARSWPAILPHLTLCAQQQCRQTETQENQRRQPTTHGIDEVNGCGLLIAHMCSTQPWAPPPGTDQPDGHTWSWAHRGRAKPSIQVDRQQDQWRQCRNCLLLARETTTRGPGITVVGQSHPERKKPRRTSGGFPELRE